MRHFLAAIVFLALAGCTDRPEAEGTDGRGGGESTPTTGMNMEMSSMGMMTTMRGHMDSMRTASLGG